MSVLNNIFDNELNYYDFFRKDIEKGYQIERTIVYTYSLDLTFLSVLFMYADSMKRMEIYPDDTHFVSQPLCEKVSKSFLLENEQGEFEQKMEIFCQENRVMCSANSLSSNMMKAISVWDGIHTIACNDGTSFHPKVILLELKKQEECQGEHQEKYRYRLMVATRNMTTSQSIEMGMVLQSKESYASSQLCTKEGISDGDVTHDAENRSNQYHKLFAHYSKVMEGMKWELLPCAVTSEKKNMCVSVQDVKVHFQYGSHLEVLDDEKNQHSSMSEKMEMGTIEEIMILSPGFFDNKFLNSCMEKGLDKCTLYFHEESHIKLYLINRAGKAELWIGSSNCSRRGLGTDKGWGRNTECMAQVKFGEGSWETIRDQLRDWCEDKKNGYRIWDKQMEDQEDNEDLNDVDEKGKEQLVKRLDDVIGNGKFNVCVKPVVQEKENSKQLYNVKITYQQTENCDGELSFDADGLKKTLECIQVGMLSFFSSLNYNKGTCDWSCSGIEGSSISNRLRLNYTEDGTTIFRVVTAEVNAEFEKLLVEKKKDLQVRLGKELPLFPDIKGLNGNKDLSDKTTGTGNYHNHFVIGDGIYEKVMKLYASNYWISWTDYVKKNFKDKTDFICLIEGLEEGGRN